MYFWVFHFNIYTSTDTSVIKTTELTVVRSRNRANRKRLLYRIRVRTFVRTMHGLLVYLYLNSARQSRSSGINCSAGSFRVVLIVLRLNGV